MFRRTGLFLKFFLSISLLIMLSSSLLSYFMIRHEISRIRSDMIEYGRTLVGELARDSEYGVTINNRKILGDILETMMASKNVIYAIVEDKAGSVLAYSEGASGMPIPKAIVATLEAAAAGAQTLLVQSYTSDIFNEPILDFAVPITSMSEDRRREEIGFSPEPGKLRSKIGVARVAMSLAQMNGTIQSLIQMAQLITLGVVLLGMFVTAILVGIITRPLRQLMDRMKRVSAGELTPIEITSGGEIGMLAGAFNQMVRDLKKYRTELEGYHKSLQTKVYDREREAHELKTYSENIIATMAEGLVVLDPEGKIEMVNNALKGLSGMEEDELLGKRFVQTLFPGKGREAAIDALETARRKGIMRDLDLNLNSKDGKEVPVNLNAAILRDAYDKPIGMVVILHDMTKEREADKMKTEFISTISHELRTPLTSIEGFVSLILAKKVGEIEPKQEEFLKIVQSQSKHLRELIQNLLDFSRLATGKVRFNSTSLAVDSIVSEIINVTKPQIDSKGLHLEVDIEKDLPKVAADAEKVQMAFSNILGNSIKFTEKGGKIKVSVSRKDGDILVSVSDNGMGIAKENLDTIFQRFFQIDSSLTRKIGGAGIGLSVAKEAVESHGGRIWAESEGVGFGATLKFTLPMG
jgi:NtrC-family two-component system sensor histidine kinase KinB